MTQHDAQFAFKRQSLMLKMILQIVPAFLVALAAVTVAAILVTNASEKDLAYQRTLEETRDHANAFDAEMQANLSVARTIADTMEAYGTKNRDEVSDILRHLLEHNPNLIGSYVGYEPNAFDGQDARFVSAEGHDATGRFVPYWNRLQGSIALEPLVDYDTSDYYQLPKKTGADSVIEPYLYQGVLMASFISPIKMAGAFIGIGGVDVSLNDLDGQISQIKIFDTGYAFLVSNTGIFVSAPDKALIGTQTLSAYAQDKGNPALSQVADDIRSGKEGFVETTDPFTGKQVALFYSPVSTGQWGFVTVAPLDEMLAGVNRLRTLLIAIGLLALVLMVGLVAFIASRLARPIVALSQAAERIASGDLDINLVVTSQDEVGQMQTSFSRMTAYFQNMARVAGQIAGGDLTEEVAPQSEKDVLGNAFARMTVSLREALGQVAASAASVNAASAQLVTVAGQAGQATNQIAATMQQVARGTSQQTEGVTKTAGSMEQMKRAIEGVAKGAQEQAQSAGQTASAMSQLAQAIAGIQAGAQAQAQGMGQATQAQATLAQGLEQMAVTAGQVSTEAEQAARSAVEGAGVAGQTAKGMERVRAATEQLAARVRELGQRSGQIGSIIETIDDIAAQTNLLALNAAIEAARAGEHGRGFAVVADEVRKLAERTSQATKEIGDMIRLVQGGANETVEAMQQAGGDVAQAAELTDKAGAAFEAIQVGAKGSAERVRGIGEAIAGLQRLGEQLGRAVSEAAAGAGRNQGAAEAMTRLSQTVVESVDRVSAVVEENTAATEEMAAGSSEVAQAIENIASVSEENSAAVEEVSASAEEMSAQVQEVTANAQSLAQMAQALQQVVAQFKLETGEASPAPLSAAPASAAFVPPINGRVLVNGHTSR